MTYDEDQLTLPGISPAPLDTELWYLATPYEKFAGGKEAAFQMATQNAAILVNEGVPLFCPIAQNHPIEKTGLVEPKPHDFWMDLDYAVFRVCEGLIVVTAEGWLTSRGVTQEIAWAKAASMPIVYMKEGEFPQALDRYRRKN